MPDGGSTLFVPAAVGKARAFQMALLGERVPAEQALDWGLVNAVHPDDELEAEADALVDPAGRRARPAPTPASKRALNRMLYPDLDGQLDLEAELQHALARTKDFQEGVAAFVEKRDAGVPGRAEPGPRATVRHEVEPQSEAGDMIRPPCQAPAHSLLLAALAAALLRS